MATYERVAARGAATRRDATGCVPITVDLLAGHRLGGPRRRHGGVGAQAAQAVVERRERAGGAEAGEPHVVVPAVRRAVAAVGHAEGDVQAAVVVRRAGDVLEAELHGLALAEHGVGVRVVRGPRRQAAAQRVRVMPGDAAVGADLEVVPVAQLRGGGAAGVEVARAGEHRLGVHAHAVLVGQVVAGLVLGRVGRTRVWAAAQLRVRGQVLRALPDGLRVVADGAVDLDDVPGAGGKGRALGRAGVVAVVGVVGVQLERAQLRRGGERRRRERRAGGDRGGGYVAGLLHSDLSPGNSVRR